MPVLKHIFLSILALSVGLLVRCQTAYLQLGNASADISLQLIDVYLDSIKLVDDLEFRSSSSYFEISGNELLSIAPSNSVDTSTAIYSIQLSIANGSRTSALFNGNSGTGYTPAKPFNVHFRNNASMESSFPGYTDLIFYNGATDLSSADFEEITLLNQTLGDNIPYGSFSSGQPVESLGYRLNVANADQSKIYRQLELDLLGQGWADSTITIALSGFLDPISNSNGSLMSALLIPPSGGDWIQLPLSTALVQVINNSPDELMTEADFYYGNNLLADNVGFRSATSYLEVIAGMSLSIGAATGSSAQSMDTVVAIPTTLEANKTYVFILNGISSAQYRITSFESRLNATVGYNTDIIVINGSTDVGRIDIEQISPQQQNLVSALDFGERTSYLETPSADYRFSLEQTSGNLELHNYHVPLNGPSNKGTAQIWVVSGFADTINYDSNMRIGIWVAKSSGGPLTELSQITGVETTNTSNVSVYPNPVGDLLHLHGERITRVQLIDLFGTEVLHQFGDVTSLNVSVVPSGTYRVVISQHQNVHHALIVIAH
ncbi:MAG: DUF4397 domain-containing protein [Flavobacteriales bacterium]